MKGTVSVYPESNLIFKKLDGQTPISEFTISNNMSGPIVYKVKVTHPTVFSVTPPYGFIPECGKGRIDVKLTLEDGKTLPNNPRLQVLIYPGEGLEKLNWDSISTFIKANNLKEFSSFILHCRANVIELPSVDTKANITTPKTEHNAVEYRNRTSTPLVPKSNPPNPLRISPVLFAIIFFLIIILLYFILRNIF